jgi:hypothetical protein
MVPAYRQAGDGFDKLTTGKLTTSNKKSQGCRTWLRGIGLSLLFPYPLTYAR